MFQRLVFLVLMFLPMGFAFSHEGATGVVKERMDAMKAIARSTKILSEMVRGEREYDAGIAIAATVNIEKASALSKSLYPNGSNEHPSEVTETIWEKPKEFEAGLEGLEEAARKLRTVLKDSKSLNDVRNGFAVIASSCKSCHSEFRQKQ